MSLYRFEANALSGQKIDLSDYKDQVVLIVNTASKCGMAHQLSELETLYQDYKSEGFVVLGFPCDQFNNQEHAEAKDIETACTINFGVTFPMFEKIDVNGQQAHPLFKWLKNQKSGWLGSAIKWNYTKFLIDRDGKVVKRYGPRKKPEKLRVDIAKTLT